MSKSTFAAFRVAATAFSDLGNRHKQKDSIHTAGKDEVEQSKEQQSPAAQEDKATTHQYEQKQIGSSDTTEGDSSTSVSPTPSSTSTLEYPGLAMPNEAKKRPVLVRLSHLERDQHDLLRHIQFLHTEIMDINHQLRYADHVIEGLQHKVRDLYGVMEDHCEKHAGNNVVDQKLEKAKATVVRMGIDVKMVWKSGVAGVKQLSQTFLGETFKSVCETMKGADENVQLEMVVLISMMIVLVVFMIVAFHLSSAFQATFVA